MQTKTPSVANFVLAAVVILLLSLLSFQEARSQNVESADPGRAPSGVYLNYQGQISDNNGVPLNTTVSMKFELFKTLTDGSACGAWAETHSIAVSEGIFSVELGRVAAIPDSCLVDDVYLQLTVNGEALSPRESASMVANTMPAGASTRGSLWVGNDLWLNANRSIFMGDAQIYSADSHLYLNWHRGGALHYGGGAQTDRFAVDTSGNGTFSGSGFFAGNISMSNTEVLRRGEGNLYILPWKNETFTRVMVGGGNSVDLHITGNLSIGGSCTASLVAGNEVADAECTGGSLTTGAIIEANLQTREEMLSDKIDRFEQGDLLCWSPEAERLERCAVANDRLVMAVADRNGKPIVMGVNLHP